MKTAVEWLIEAMYQETYPFNPKYSKIFEQAKEMEKEQIEDAMDWIMNKYFEFHEQPTTSAREQYYNETFKSE
jgi:hemoglobin-like flavoprotein